MGIFLDLPKAYDVLNHDILSQKLINCGLTGSSLKLILSVCLTELKAYRLV